MPGLCFPPTGAGDQEGDGAGALSGIGRPGLHLLYQLSNCVPRARLGPALGYTSFVSKIRVGLEPELPFYK